MPPTKNSTTPPPPPPPPPLAPQMSHLRRLQDCSLTDTCYYYSPPPPFSLSPSFNSSTDSPPHQISPSPSPPPFPSSHSFHLTPLFLTLLLLASISLLLFLLSSLLCLLFRRRRRRLLAYSNSNGSVSLPHPNEEHLLYEEGEAENHVWYIRTAGLDAPAIASITKWAYEPGAIEFFDCPVCLAGFRAGEVLRLLPGCRHAFHLPCIDPWLAARTTCPLCRAPVVPGTDTEAGGSTSRLLGDFLELNSGPLSDLEMTQIGIRAWEAENALVEEERSLGSEIGFGGETESNLVQSLMQESSGFRLVRRSVSMDSLSLDALLIGVQGRGDKSRERKGSASKSSAQKGMIEMARSPSGGSSVSRRFFRHVRARSSTLPL